MKPRIEGYWRAPYAPELPMPEGFPDWQERAGFLKALAQAEAEAPCPRPTKGFSTCRVCGCINGSVEFELDGWRWPEGFAHYVADHQVRPSADFEIFIMQRDA